MSDAFWRRFDAQQERKRVMVREYIAGIIGAPLGVSVPVPEHITTEQFRECHDLAREHRAQLDYALQADGVYAV